MQARIPNNRLVLKHIQYDISKQECVIFGKPGVSFYCNAGVGPGGPGGGGYACPLF